MKTLKYIFLWTKDKDWFIHFRAVNRVKKGVLSQKEQENVKAHLSRVTFAQVVGFPISMAVAYYIPIPDYFSPIISRFCIFVFCYRSIYCPFNILQWDYYKEIAIKYDLLSKPELLYAPGSIPVYPIDQILDSGKNEINESFHDYKERIIKDDNRLYRAYIFDQSINKNIAQESFEEYKDRRLREEKIIADAAEKKQKKKKGN